MDADELLLFFSFLIFWIILVFLVVKTKSKKQIGINLAIHVIYSSYFLYGLFFKSQGNGTA